MSAQITGGAVRRSEKEPSIRHWTASDRLRWSDDAGSGEVAAALPSSEPVVAADPWSVTPFILLADGDAWHGWMRSGTRHTWVRHMNLFSGRVDMVKEKDPPRLIGGWIERRSGQRIITGLTTDRRVWLMLEDAPARAISGPLPGTARVLSALVDGHDRAVALLDTGAVLVTGPRGWSEVNRLGGVAGQPDSGLVRCVALTGVRIARNGKIVDIRPGETFESPAAQAREWVSRGMIEFAGPPEPVGPDAA